MLSADLSQEPDFSIGATDLRSADLRVPADLSSAGDLAGPVDLAQPPDMAKITNCVLIPQSGCPAGNKCTTHDAASTLCDPSGTVPRGNTCATVAQVDNCVAGAFCTDEGGGIGQCRGFCNKDGDCGFQSYCDFTLGMPMKFHVCTQPCTATYPGSGCTTGLGCTVYGDEHTNCIVPGPVGETGACSKITDCKSGLACINIGTSQCLRVCKLMVDNCPGITTCNPVTGPSGTWMTYGVCF